MYPPGQQVNNCCPPENKMAALNLRVYKCFSSLFKDYTDLRDEKYTAGNRKCCGNPLGKFLNFKIIYFVLFLSQSTIVV